MSRDFEVIVVGAGPAGSMMIKELAKRKIRALCIEKEVEVGYTNKSTAATPLDTFETFEIPRELGFDDAGGFRIFGPTEVCVKEFPATIGRLLMFREVKQYLIKEAIRSGAHLMLGTEVIDVLEEDGKVIGVTYKGFEGKGELTANIVVDASGPSSVLAARLGLWKKRPEQLGVAFEYFLDNAKPDKGPAGCFFLDFFMGSNVAPGGYGWIFPTSSTQVKAGMCKLNPAFRVPNEMSQKKYFQKIWEENSQIKNAQPFEIHECAHYITGGTNVSVKNGFMAIGDSVSKVNPIWGEGVRASFYSATFAAQAIDEAKKHNDYSEKRLSLYDQLWKKRLGKNWSLSKIVYDVLYNSKDDQLDAFIRILKKVDSATLQRLYLGKATKKDYFFALRLAPGFMNKDIISATMKTIIS